MDNLIVWVISSLDGLNHNYAGFHIFQIPSDRLSTMHICMNTNIQCKHVYIHLKIFLILENS